MFLPPSFEQHKAFVQDDDLTTRVQSTPSKSLSGHLQPALAALPTLHLQPATLPPGCLTPITNLGSLESNPHHTPYHISPFPSRVTDWSSLTWSSSFHALLSPKSSVSFWCRFFFRAQTTVVIWIPTHPSVQPLEGQRRTRSSPLAAPLSLLRCPGRWRSPSKVKPKTHTPPTENLRVFFFSPSYFRFQPTRYRGEETKITVKVAAPWGRDITRPPSTAVLGVESRLSAYLCLPAHLPVYLGGRYQVAFAPKTSALLVSDHPRRLV